MHLLTSLRTQSWGLTVLRVVTGLIFLVHGWQKISVFGLAGFTGFLTQLGVPGASVAAVVVIAAELLGGMALILGLGTRFVAVALAIDVLVAMLIVHLPAGFFVDAGGYEFVLVLLASNIALMLAGGGALALDHLLAARRGSIRTAAAG